MATNKLGMSDILKIVAVLVGAGVAWIASHETTVYGLLVIALVWLANLYFQKTGKHVGKQALTIIVYVLSVVLAFVLHPAMWPAFPAWCSAAIVSLNATTVTACSADPSSYANALVLWGGSILSLGTAVFSFATVVYNTILEKVLAQLGPAGTS